MRRLVVVGLLIVGVVLGACGGSDDPEVLGVQLEREGVVTGVVSRADDGPAAAVQIVLSAGTIRRESLTGSDGRYRFTKVPAGAARLDVTDTGDAGTGCAPGAACVSGRAARSTTQFVTVAPGRTTTANLTL